MGETQSRSRAGRLKTNLMGESGYRSFMPTPLPPNPAIVLDEELVELLVSATKHITLLDAVSARIQNINIFVSMYVRKEALMSSQIEGTQATLEDVLDPLMGENVNRNVADIVNYIKATEYAVNRISELPLCNRLIKETHAVLMEGVRGQEKNPGEFRRSQNWIGGQGSTLKTARYIPPNVEDMIEAMSDLEKYMNADDNDELDVLIRAALIHYQFETIHPFLDGNGRVGRLLITLFLMDKDVLHTPSLYISYFLKQNRIEYYDRISEVRRSGNFEQWVKFFLRAVANCAADAVAAIDKLTALHDKNTEIVIRFGRASATACLLLSYLEENPIIDIAKTATALQKTFKATSDAVSRLTDAGILVQSGGGERNRTFSYKEYLDILKEGTQDLMQGDSL